MIVSCGEAVLDELPDGSTLLGGAPFNVAIGIARLDGASAFLGALPKGSEGEHFREALSRAGVSRHLLQQVDRPICRAMVAFRDGAIAYDFAPADSADRHLSVPAKGALDEADALSVGSLALARLPSAEVIEAIVSSFSGFLALDPNVRTGAIEDEAGWRSRIEQIAARADLVKLSVEDAAVLYPGRSSAAIAKQLLESGSGAVVITAGALGATAYLQAARVDVGALRAEAEEGADSVGAGDSFSAGLLVALAEGGVLIRGGLARATGEEILPLLGFAAAAAAVTCGRRGAYAPTRGEVEALAARRSEVG